MCSLIGESIIIAVEKCGSKRQVNGCWQAIFMVIEDRKRYGKIGDVFQWQILGFAIPVILRCVLTENAT